MKEKFLKIALAEVGYKEGKNNDNKYGKWYGMNNCSWCAIFVSWCAAQVGIIKTLIPRYSGCGTGYNWFKNKGLITMKPKAGDIGFIKPTKPTATSSHTFIVYKVDGNVITTIEGNYPDGVKKITRKLTDKNILGFGSVQWEDEEKLPNKATISEVKQESTKSITYVVKKGDTLAKIAKKHNTTWNKIYNDNKLLIDKEAKKRGVKSNYYNHIYTGQKLIIK
ncbi:MAG: LysM peptidoglycan-binding domain-containing protein [Bacilli bacterium]|nr:LysM peptidoglycan-binding domain-containing protein [Bacilli bacterium]